MSLEIFLFFLIASAVTVGSLVPARVLPPLPNDKLMHFVAYAGLAILVTRLAPEKTLFLCIAMLFIGGWMIEVLQNLVPGRNFCWHDMVANTFGIACGASVAHYFSMQ